MKPPIWAATAIFWPVVSKVKPIRMLRTIHAAPSQSALRKVARAGLATFTLLRPNSRAKAPSTAEIAPLAPIIGTVESGWSGYSAAAAA